MSKLTNVILIVLSAVFIAACGGATQPKNNAVSVSTDKPTRIVISKRGFEPKEISAKKGQTVKLEFFREDGENCGEELVFPKQNIKKSLAVGATETVEFTPQETGEIAFTCGMDMLRGKLIVSD
jgi:plastocyanin domain-containing protein